MLYNYLKMIYYFVFNYFSSNNIANYTFDNSANRECIILGNGPSINKDYDDIYEITNSATTFVVNNFIYSDLYQKIKPKYYFLIDPIYWSNDVDINLIEERNIFAEIRKKTTWNLNIIVPYVAYKNIKKEFNNITNIQIYFYNHTVISWNGKKNLIFNLYKNIICTPRFQNVVTAAIFFSIIFNFKKVSLFGVEHSWLKDIYVDNNNQVCWKEKHFYGIKKLRPHLKSNGENYKLYELLFDYGHMFKTYHMLKKFAEINNCKIINYTPESFIDAFDKITN